MLEKSVPTIVKRKNCDFEVLNREDILSILGTVVYDKAFFFFEGIGKPTGDFAISISDFCGKINGVSPKSVFFHLKRGDFEKWVSEVIGDRELSDRIHRLKMSRTGWKEDGALKNRLLSTVKDRVVELQDLWQNALTRLEDSAA